MRLDIVTARRALDAGWPVPWVFYCRNGHSERAHGGAGGDVRIPRAWWEGYLVSIGAPTP